MLLSLLICQGIKIKRGKIRKKGKPLFLSSFIPQLQQRIVLEQKQQRLMDVVPDGLAGGFVQFADCLAADGFGFAEEQAVGVIQVAASEPADVDVVLFDPDVAEAALGGAQRGDVCAVFFFGVVADAGFDVVPHL